MSAPPPDPERERRELAAGRCPWSGLVLSRTEIGGGAHRFMCGVCDCFGYRPEELGQ